MVFLGLGAMVPIVAQIITRHKQRMAEIANRSGRNENSSEVSQLRSEVSELKEMLHQQMIAVDSIISAPRFTRDEPIQQRLEQTK